MSSSNPFGRFYYLWAHLVIFYDLLLHFKVFDVLFSWMFYVIDIPFVFFSLWDILALCADYN